MAQNSIREKDLRQMIHAQRVEHAPQRFTCRPHEGLALPDFLIPGGLPNDHEVCSSGAIPRDEWLIRQGTLAATSGGDFHVLAVSLQTPADRLAPPKRYST
jgi:hypothetical protein